MDEEGLQGAGRSPSQLLAHPRWAQPGPRLPSQTMQGAGANCAPNSAPPGQPSLGLHGHLQPHSHQWLEGKRGKKTEKKKRKKKKEESQSPPQTPLLSFVFSLSTASPNCTVAGQALCPKLPVQQKFPPGCSLRGCVLQSFAHLLGVFHRQRDPWYEAMGHHRLRAGTS